MRVNKSQKQIPISKDKVKAVLDIHTTIAEREVSFRNSRNGETGKLLKIVLIMTLECGY